MTSFFIKGHSQIGSQRGYHFIRSPIVITLSRDSFTLYFEIPVVPIRPCFILEIDFIVVTKGYTIIVLFKSLSNFISTTGFRSSKFTVFSAVSLKIRVKANQTLRESD